MYSPVCSDYYEYMWVVSIKVLLSNHMLIVAEVTFLNFVPTEKEMKTEFTVSRLILYLFPTNMLH